MTRRWTPLLNIDYERMIRLLVGSNSRFTSVTSRKNEKPLESGFGDARQADAPQINANQRKTLNAPLTIERIVDIITSSTQRINCSVSDTPLAAVRPMNFKMIVINDCT